MKRLAAVAVAAVLLSAGFAASAKAPARAATACGVWRWPVKTGSDADRYKVRWTAQDTSIHYLRGLTPPSYFGTYSYDHRIKWPEDRTWELLGTHLVKAIEEDDGDLHLVLANSLGRTMIAEIPKSSCVSSASLWKTQIYYARKALLSRYSVGQYSWTYINRRVNIRGLGFFDENHGQTGVAPNGIELHPVTHIRFL